MSHPTRFGYLLPETYPNQLLDAAPSRKAPPRRLMLLGLLLITALLPRVWMAVRTETICPDGTFYIQLAQALEHAHASDLIHRDVKPKNIIITQSGQAKLADLGLARAISDIEQAEAEAGQTFGTPFYMSPEQARGDRDIGPAADIYGLGATFFHMLTGDPPFTGTTSKQVMDRHLNEPAASPREKNPAVTEGVADVILKMLAKEPSARYASCDELLAELRAWKSFHILKRGEKDR